MIDYYLRTTEPLWPVLLDLGVRLGAIKLDEDGKPYAVSGAFDFIGPIYEPTGDVIDEQPVMEPLRSPSGDIYWHANLRTDLDLRELQAASDDAEITSADLSMFFVADETGELKAPDHPRRVFLPG
jgi:hypothetical protein